MNWLASLAARIAVLGPAAIRGGATYLRQLTIRSSDKIDDGAVAGGAGLVLCAYRFGASAVWRLVKGSAPALYIYADARPAAASSSPHMRVAPARHCSYHNVSPIAAARLLGFPRAQLLALRDGCIKTRLRLRIRHSCRLTR